MKLLIQSTQAYKIVKTESRENRLSHAYLLLFDDARNLRFTLKEFSKVLFKCDDTGFGLTQTQKRISELIDSESFSDCLFFPAQGKKLAVDDAEKIREECMIRPIEGDKKVIAIGDFAEANVQTQNKLLKLLEEPPAGVTFLLGATSSYPVLTTVLSRTKKLEILSFDIRETAECLERIYGSKYDESALSLCAATADGNVGRAQNMLEGGTYKTVLEQSFSLALATTATLPLIVKKVGETKQPKTYLSMLRLIFRDALLIKTQGNRAERNLLLRSEKESLAQVAKKYSAEALLYAQETISDAEKQAAFNAVFPQCIEICVAKIQSKNK